MSFLGAILIKAPLFALATILYGSVGIIVSFFDATGDKQLGVARAWARALLRIALVRVVVEGTEKIACDGSYVFASNHLSYMDSPVILANVPVRFRFLAKRGLFQIPFLGTHLAQAGHIPVPREDPRAAIKTLTLAAQTIRDRHTSLLLFPEGGRSESGKLREFKDGAAYIAIKAGVPVVPLALVGTFDVLPMHSLHLRGGLVRMRIGDPIPTAGLALRDRTRLTEELRGRIAEMLSPEHASTHA
jgi:1-acyl-sn-glycerol-3-phosphate acyltransferase